MREPYPQILSFPLARRHELVKKLARQMDAGIQIERAQTKTPQQLLRRFYLRKQSALRGRASALIPAVSHELIELAFVLRRP